MNVATTWLLLTRGFDLDFFFLYSQMPLHLHTIRLNRFLAPCPIGGINSARSLAGSTSCDRPGEY